jgi:bromodomain adjacent to zinc finger domain protein 1A
VLEEKRLEKLRGGRSSSVASSSGGRRQSGTSATLSLEEQLRLNSERDDETEREFRRYLGVTRCRPLGRDRFHCRYWWFDGIGGMNLAGTGKGEVTYGTGRLFVQGPSVEDWELICDSRKEEGDGSKSMLERRMREEVVDDPSALLGPDEWAYYEDEDEVSVVSCFVFGSDELNWPLPASAAGRSEQLAEREGHT